jgi:hypothetical protein
MTLEADGHVSYIVTRGDLSKFASNNRAEGTPEENKAVVQPPNGKPFQLKGYWANIVVREGDAWKIWMSASMVIPAPAATASPTSSPSN